MYDSPGLVDHIGREADRWETRNPQQYVDRACQPVHGENIGVNVEIEIAERVRQISEVAVVELRNDAEPSDIKNEEQGGDTEGHESNRLAEASCSRKAEQEATAQLGERYQEEDVGQVLEQPTRCPTRDVGMVNRENNTVIDVDVPAPGDQGQPQPQCIGDGEENKRAGHRHHI